MAHESAHATIYRLKPGWRGGASLILHEGLADAFTFLTALRRGNTVERILKTTGGDLRLANEASEIVAFPDGGTLRSALTNKSLRDYAIDRNILRLFPIPGSPEDPHFASVVLTAAIYDAFLRLADRAASESSLSVESIRSAADDTGRIMVAVLQLSDENRATLEGYSTAFLDAAQILYGEEVRDLIRDPFFHRSLVNHVDPAPEAIGRIFTLSVDPADFDPSSFVSDLLSFDDTLSSIARGPDRNNNPSIPLLLYDLDNMYARRVVPSSVRVFDVVRDPISAPGGIYVRVEYEYEHPGASIEDAAKYQTSDVSDIPVRKELSFAGYLFDKDGGIVAVHVDRPL